MRQLRTIALLTVLLGLSVQCRPVQQETPRPSFDQIEPVIQEEIEKGNFPGAVVLVGREDEILYWKAFGYQVVEPHAEPMSKDTVFDLASLTKPVATATTIMILRDRKAIDLDDYAGKYLPAFACSGKQEVRIRHLLAHTSGLPAYTNADALKEQFGSPCPEKLIEKICLLEAVSKPGEEFRYSCLGYITLAQIVEVASGESIDDFSRENIFAPLGMKHTAFNPPDSWRDDIAGTEMWHGLPAREDTAKMAVPQTDERLLRGTVHDPLARLMAGASGNAGLFSNARDLSIYCRMLLNGGVWKGRRILSPEGVTLLTSEQVFGRAYGFDVNSSYASVKGSYAPKEAFCHTGYTGTSIVCDPASKTFVIILTNRIHPKDDGTTKPVRSKVADIVFSSLQKSSDQNGGSP
jgi:CubicO group peptidase (beta-lactamase class C family)